MDIHANEVGKKFGNEWIIKDFTYHFKAPQRYAILGSNGSGKSTLLKIISGFMVPGKGTINYSENNTQVPAEQVFQQISYAAPYIELVEEFTCIENIAFQLKFKPFFNQASAQEVLEISGLKNAANKEIKNFSSGMKQRLKLTLAIMANCPVLLLDEPCSNLDAKAIEWYAHMLETYAKNKLVIICSNHLHYEYSSCEHLINTEDFKPQ